MDYGNNKFLDSQNAQQVDDDDDVDEYLRKIYLARKKRSHNRGGGVEPAAMPVTTEAAANCVATAKEASLNRSSQRSHRAPAEPQPEPPLFSSSFAAAAQLRKQQQLGDSTMRGNGSASHPDSSAERFSQVEEPIVDREGARKVGQIIREARQRGSPEREAEPGAVARTLQSLSSPACAVTLSPRPLSTHNLL